MNGVKRIILENLSAGQITKQDAMEALQALDGVGQPPAEDIAIIGMSGTVSMAEDLEQFWDNQLNNRNSFVAKPAERLVEDRVWENPHYAELFDRAPHEEKHEDLERYVGAYLPSTLDFDERFFGIAPAEADAMDPQHRVFLQQAWQALENAGYCERTIRGSSTGVFVGRDGTNSNVYRRVVDSDNLGGIWEGIVASRINYEYDLKGPAYVFDTACSSSLVAIHMAAQALNNDECTMAVAGGVCLTAAGLDRDEIEIESLLNRQPAPGNVVSDNYRVSTFDAKADGTVFGEGAAAIILKKLSDAERDGDHIYGVIASSATNSDGASNGLTAPNPRAQTALLTEAWRRAAVDPEQIEYIEAHGTGTSLGDPIEVLGISNAFKSVTDRRQFCGIGSLKTSVGHTVGAAGVMGVIKLLLSMRDDVLPASLNFEEPNSQIDFINSPVYVVDRNRPWPRRETPRYAGVSAFGFSGTNAHVLLRDYQSSSDDTAAEQTPEAGTARIFTVSAKTETAFQNYLAKYQRYFAKGEEPAFEDLCFTASTGRDHLDYRLAIVASDVPELRRKFTALMESGQRPDPAQGIFIGRHRVVSDRTTELAAGDIKNSEWSSLNKRTAASIAEAAEASQGHGYLMREIARDYVRGAQVAFADLYPQGAHRIPLPTYPFDRNHHFAKPRVSALTAERAPQGDELDQPLLHRMLTETDDVAVYETTLSHDHWAVSDHRILGQYYVAGTVLLELMAEAVRTYFGTDQVAFAEVLFLSPVLAEVDTPMSVQVVARIDAEGTTHLRLQSREAGSSDEWVPNATAEASVHTDAVPVPVRTGAEIRADEDLREVDVTHNAEFGPRWKNLKQRWVSESDPDVAYGYAELPAEYQSQAEHDGYLLHPGLLDCTVSMVPYLAWLRPRVYLPLTYRALTVHRPLPFAYFVRSERLPGRSEEVMGFRTTLFTEDGEVIAEIEQFAMKRVTELADFVSGSYSYLHWAPQDRTEDGSLAEATGALLIVGDDSPLVDELKSRAAERRVVQLQLGSRTEQRGENTFVTEPTEDAIAATLTKIGLDGVSDVIDLVSYTPDRQAADGAALDEELTTDLTAFLGLLKGLFSQGGAALSISVVADHAQAVSGAEPFVDAAHAAKIAVLTSVRHEVPNFTFSAIDADASTPVQTIVDELAAPAGLPPFVAFRDGVRHTAQLSETSPDGVPPSGVTIQGASEGFYLITGGLGALGSAVAVHLGGHAEGPGVFVLASRRNPLPPREQWEQVLAEEPESRVGQILSSVMELESGGHTVIVAEIDIADADSVTAALDRIRNEHGPLRGIVHAAGVAGDGFLYTKPVEEFQRVMAPKAQAMRNLVDWCGEHRPDFFIAFSSMTAITGGAGQSDYAAANAFLDSYAQDLRRQGFNAQAINWPGWSERGMAVDAGLQDAETFFEHLGTGSGVTAFMEILSRAITGVVPAKPNLGVLAAVGEDYFPFEFSDALRRAVRRQAGKTSQQADASAEAPTAGRIDVDLDAITISGISEEDLDPIERSVTHIFAGVLGADEIDVNDSFTAMGGNSILATELMRVLNTQFGDVVSISDVFSFTTPLEMAAHIAEATGADAAAVEAPASEEGPGQSQDFDSLVAALESGDIDAASMRDMLAKEG